MKRKLSGASGIRARAGARYSDASRKAATYIENICESGCACLVTMVQGNLVALTAAHWLTASQTGLVAGALASSAIVTAKLRRPWVVSCLLGVATTVADLLVHPGHFGAAAATESAVTGIGAASLSLLLNLGRRSIVGMARRVRLRSGSRAKS